METNGAVTALGRRTTAICYGQQKRTTFLNERCFRKQPSLHRKRDVPCSPTNSVTYSHGPSRRNRTTVWRCYHVPSAVLASFLLILSCTVSIAYPTSFLIKSKRTSICNHRRWVPFHGRAQESESPKLLLLALGQQPSSSDDPINNDHELLQQHPNHTTISSISSFGDVVSLRQKPLSPSDTSRTNSTTSSSSSGEAFAVSVVPTTAPPTVGTATATTTTTAAAVIAVAVPIMNERELLQQMRFRNTIVAVVSVCWAFSSFVWQYLHPLEPIQILYRLEQASVDMSVVGKNHKPTIIDFWAPWCDNCKLSAATLQSIEDQYSQDMNLILLNGDTPANFPYIEALGVDAIPHMALISYDGIVETALIGPIPKHILQADIEVLLRNSRNNAPASATTTTTTDTDVPTSIDHPNTNQDHQHMELPYKMLDVFAGKPDSNRRIQF
jgi:thiol-disulfide isomerase/thioredoxin